VNEQELEVAALREICESARRFLVMDARETDAILAEHYAHAGVRAEMRARLLRQLEAVAVIAANENKSPERGGTA
jgi:hypothetical protein